MKTATIDTTLIAGEQRREVRIPVGDAVLEGELHLPHHGAGLVVFVHGSGSSRSSPRNQMVARMMRRAELGTLLFDLLTREEQVVDEMTRELRFNIEMLAGRLVEVTRWLQEQPEALGLKTGYFGASTGAAAALMAAAVLGDEVGAVVSRGGRPDLAGDSLPQVTSPTLLIVGGHDAVVVGLNQDACEKLRCRKSLRIVPGATHLFEELGALEEVARLSAAWFRRHLAAEQHVEPS